MKKVTSSDVAKRAGVSQSTVSFVLNGRADIAISESTRRRVLEAAKQLNYVPGGFPLLGVNDMVAFGALQALTDSGVSVPEQVSLCGFDNLYLSQIVSPGITTVDHALPECCRAAFSAVMDFSAHRQQSLFRMEYEPRLIVRRSTAPAAR